MAGNFIPKFIYKKYLENETAGKLNGTAMFVDVVGFTSMTQDLIEHGKAGAEVLSEVIYQIFEPIIDSVYIGDGWIISFEGDALTAVFPDSDRESAIRSACEIQRLLNQITLNTEYGEFPLQIRIGLSSGEIEWSIIESESQNTFYFRGSAIDKCSQCEHQAEPGEIIIDKDLKNEIKESIRAEKKNEKYYLIKNFKEKEKRVPSFKSVKIDESVISQFIPEAILNLRELGEFRNIVSLFISFSGDGNLDEFIKNIIKKVHRYGGYFNKVVFGDKGGIMLIIFGAPTAIEKSALRASDFALHLISSSEDFNIRMGITSGVVYAGMVGGGNRMEYTVLGEVVNLSARLALKASPGDMYMGENFKKRIEKEFRVKNMGTHELKGIKKEISIYSLKEKKHSEYSFYKGDFIGREKELEALKDSIEPMNENKFGGIIYIDGSAGIGKSRLIYELENELGKENYNWFYLPCDDVLRESFNPVVSFLKNYFEQKEENPEKENKKQFTIKFNSLTDKIDDETLKKELKRVKSIIGGLINLHWKDSLYEKLDPRGRYDNTLNAIKNLIKAESMIKPSVLIIEDGQWIDGETEEFLSMLVRNVENYPFTVILPARPEEDGSFFRLDLKDVKIKNIELAHLTAESSRTLVKEKLGGKPSPVLLKNVLERSEGNPFYIEQIILYLQDRKMLTEEKEVYDLKEKNFSIPGKISSVIISRIDRLEEKLKRTVKTASVLGKEFSVKVLSLMLDGKSIMNEIKQGEERLIWRAISELMYVFHHALIRDITYEMQLKKTLRRLHRLAAETMENLYKIDIEPHLGKIAHHYERAGVSEKAEEYLERAGDYAAGEYRNEEALGFYNRLYPYLEKDRKKLEINRKRGKILELTGRWDRAEDVFKECLKMSEKLKDDEKIAESKNNLGSVLFMKGKYQEALSLARESLQIFKELKNKKGMLSSLEILVVTRTHQADYDKAMEYLKQRLKIAKKIGDEEIIGSVNGDMAVIYVERGKHEKAMVYYKKQLKSAEKLENMRSIGVVVGNLGNLYYRLGDYRKAMDCYMRKLKISQELGYRRGACIAYGNAGNIYFCHEEYDRALEYYNKQLEISRELGDRYSQGVAFGQIGRVYFRKGDYDRAMEYFQKDLKMSEELNDKFGIGFQTGNIGKIHFNLGNYEKAMECFNKKLKISRELKDLLHESDSIFHIAEINKTREEYEKADKNYRKAIKIARELGNKYHLCEFLQRTAEFRLLRGEIKKAGLLNEKAYHIAREINRPDVVFHSKLLSCRLLSRKDKKKEAVSCLKDLLKEWEEDSIRAITYYELYKINNKEEFRKNALDLYRKLIKKTNKIEYKQKIDRLTSPPSTGKN